MKKKITYIATALVTLCILAAYLILAKPPPSSGREATKEKTWLVNATRLKKAQYSQQAILFGVVGSPKQSTLRAAINADVLKRYVKAGEFVKAGKLLVSLDSKDILLNMQQRIAEIEGIKALLKSENKRHSSDQAAIAHNQALVKLEKKSIERLRYLSRKKLGSEAAVDQAEKLLQSNLLTLKQRQLAISNHQHRYAELSARIGRLSALLNKAKLNFERTKISAPYDGKITETFVSQGDRVMPGDKLVSMYSTDDIEVRAQLPERVIPRVRALLGNKERVNAYSHWHGTKFQLSLIRLSAKIPEGHSSVDGIFRFNTTKHLPPLGATLKLTLTLPNTEKSFLIPRTALYGRERVYLIKDHRLKAVSVRRIGPAASDDKSILINSTHLSDGDLVLRSKLPMARSGLKVKIHEDD